MNGYNIYGIYGKINKQKTQLNKVGRPEEEVLMSWDNSRALQREERIFFFLERTQTMKSHELFAWYTSQISLLLYKSILLPLPCRDLFVAYHGCSPQTAIPC